jgi:hypothetical protein
MLGDFGWVAFEPTPGRGRPGAEMYTGVPETQAVESPAGLTSTTVAPTTSTTAGNGSTATTLRRDAGDVNSSGDLGSSAKPMNPLLKAALVVLAVLVLWGASVPLLLARRRARRRSGAANAAERVVVAWQEACDDLAFARPGAARRPAETVNEYAARGPSAAGFADGGEVGQAMQALAGATAMASYSPGALPAETVAGSVQAAAAVHQAVGAQVGLRRHLLWRLDPRPLIPRGTREITGKAGSRRAG